MLVLDISTNLTYRMHDGRGATPDHRDVADTACRDGQGEGDQFGDEGEHWRKCILDNR